MFLVPYRRQTFTAPAPAEVLRQRVRDYLARGMFKCKMTDKGFRLLYTTPWRGEVYRPWVFGRISAAGGVSQLNVIYTLHPFALVMMGFFVLMAWRDHSWRGVFFVAILHCGFYFLHFLPLARQLEQIFRAMMESPTHRVIG